jgi:hypothetical protein
MVDFDKKHSTELVKRPDTDLEKSRSFRSSGGQGVFSHVHKGVKITSKMVWDWVLLNDYKDEIAKAREDGNLEKARKLKIEQEKRREPRLKKFFSLAAFFIALIGWAYVTWSFIPIAVVFATGVLAMWMVGAGLKPQNALSAFTGNSDESDDPMEPFPIADARTREEAQECLRRALLAEGITPRVI